MIGDRAYLVARLALDLWRNEQHAAGWTVQEQAEYLDQANQLLAESEQLVRQRAGASDCDQCKNGTAVPPLPSVDAHFCGWCGRPVTL